MEDVQAAFSLIRPEWWSREGLNLDGKIPLLSLIALLYFSLTGCGGGAMSSSTPSVTSHDVSVSTSPPNVSLVSGGEQQYTATVSNTPNKAVTWSATAGTISSSGLFTAPNVSTTTPVVVTATSEADTKSNGSAKLMVSQVLPAPSPIQHMVSLSWRPSTSSSIVSYNMYRSTISGSSYGLLASAIGEAAYADQTVESGTNYYYVVTAVDDQGRESAQSGQKAVTVP